MKHLLIALSLLIAPMAHAGEAPFAEDRPAVLMHTDFSLNTKRREIYPAIEADRKLLILCRAAPEFCTPAQRQLNTLIDSFRGGMPILNKVGKINMAVNLMLRPIKDVGDVWSPPLDTLTKGGGDCEDYVFVKYLALLEIGIPESDMRVIVVKVRSSHETHAVLAVRINGQWKILDNMRGAMMVDRAALALYQPEFMITPENVAIYEAYIVDSIPRN